MGARVQEIRQLPSWKQVALHLQLQRLAPPPFKSMPNQNLAARRAHLLVVRGICDDPTQVYLPGFQVLRDHSSGKVCFVRKAALEFQIEFTE